MRLATAPVQPGRPAALQTVTPSPPIWPLTWQDILNDHVNAWPCPLCVRTLRGFYGCAHGRIRTPSVSARLTSEDSLPPDRLSGACRPRRPTASRPPAARRGHTLGPSVTRAQARRVPHLAKPLVSRRP